jgi:hypothetical protein
MYIAYTGVLYNTIEFELNLYIYICFATANI